MKSLLLDTNVVLDILLERQPWVADGEALWDAHENRQIQAFLTASAVTDIFYICRKIVGSNRARLLVRSCLKNLAIIAVDGEVLARADALPMDDFEDALQLACAERHGVDAIVTRDAAGFSGSKILVLAPQELIARLKTGAITGQPPEAR